MANFTIEVAINNNAFKPTPEIELARILRVLAYRVEEGEASGKIQDINGNRVGRFKIK